MGEYVIIQEWVVQEVGLAAAAVYGVVWRYCQMREGVCRASMQRMADHLGLSRTTFLTHLHTLVEQGLVIDLTPGAEGVPHSYQAVQQGSVEIVEEPAEPVAEPNTPPVQECDKGCAESQQVPVQDLNTRITTRSTSRNNREPNGSQAAPVAALVPVEQRKKESVRTVVTNHFFAESGLTRPKGGKRGTLGELWWNPIRDVCAMCDNDPEAAKRLVTDTLVKMRRDGLTVSTAKSIVNVARAIAAERARGRDGPTAKGQERGGSTAWKRMG